MNEPRPPIRQRLRYWFDNTLSSGTTAMVVWLTLATVALILVVATAAAIAEVRAEGSELSFGEALWSTLMRTLDPGTMGGDVGWPLRIASLTATIGGILVVSSLIGLLANGISGRVAELRRGRSPVLETGHTLILGWSPKVFPIISELTIANENQAGGSVVVLAAMEKDEMERLVDARVADTRETKIVCRSGVPYEPIDIAITRPDAAKSVIVLNPGHGDGDAEVVKTALALLRTAGLRDGVPVVAEVGDSFTATALRDGTNGAVSVVRSSSIIARVTAQVCRQPGLSGVYQELFDFDGDEIYFHAVPQLNGSTFAQAMSSFEQAVPLGIRFADGRVALNPPPETVLAEGDALVAIAEDDDKIVFTGKSAGRPAGSPATPPPAEAEHILLIGWNRMAPEIVRELDGYVTAGATLSIHVDPAVCRPEEVHLPETRNLEPSLLVESLDPEALRSMMSSNAPHHVIVLCYKERLSEAQADARVLLTLLHLRSAIDSAGADTNIVAELLDERDVNLTPSRQTDEFIVSERLTALLMAQLSENRDLAPVFEDLLDEEGCEIYLKPAELYAGAGETSFADVTAAATARGEIALGYQTSGNDAGRNVVINPPKSQTFTPKSEDRVIVLSESGG
jgi:voltage-gated potassium channel Kch